MKNILLDMLPDDILNRIFHYIKPSVKYALTKKYFEKFYYIRLGYINNRRIYYKNLSIYDGYIITNMKYIKFLIKNDLLLMIKNIFDYKLNNDKTEYVLKKIILFENIKFKNFFDLCYYFAMKYNSVNTIKYINKLLNDYNISIYHKIRNYKKKHKYIKNKNERWSI